MYDDWFYGFIGGLLIGCAASLFLLANGRIMGASGLIAGLVDGSGRSNRAERLWFLGGLTGLPIIVVFTTGSVPATNVTPNTAILVFAGILIGVGTRLANGCSSGHGVCGISRFSLRSIVATIIYVLSGVVTVVILRQILGLI